MSVCDSETYAFDRPRSQDQSPRLYPDSRVSGQRRRWGCRCARRCGGSEANGSAVPCMSPLEARVDPWNGVHAAIFE